MLADIRKSLATLSAPSAVPVVRPAPQFQAAVPIIPRPVLQAQASSAPQVTTQDPTTQALLAVSQLLANINTTAKPAPITIPWASNDALQNSVTELKRQVEAIAAARSATSVHVESMGPGVTPAPALLPLATSIEKSKVAEISNNQSNGVTSAEGAGQDTLLSRPGKLAAHVGSEVKEKIWSGEFVDIFSLIRAKREVEVKDKEVKASSSSDRNPKVEESITNWLFGFNAFMSVTLEKKPELGISMI
ncbi:hypothetical protein NDU88_007103 [Pleurodeles waltl]|uniref:Uncharacterized protein n=1 Tax=Pleurodeles waltl TaxID=8319 RepID=A0AAV7PSJ3_PLEWA|nr:hypothetical protein NDU88_007103 [Pleurodeles waltl]